MASKHADRDKLGRTSIDQQGHQRDDQRMKPGSFPNDTKCKSNTDITKTVGNVSLIAVFISNFSSNNKTPLARHKFS